MAPLPDAESPPPGIVVQPPSAPAGVAAARKTPDTGEDQPEEAATPPGVKAVPTATASPPSADKLVKRQPTVQRRQGEIVGRRELPPPQRPQPRSFGRTGGGGGSGLIATRSEGGKRTFVVAGRGRGGGRGGAGGGRGGPRGIRGERERRMTKPRQFDLTVVTPDVLTVEMPVTLKGLSEKLGVKANVLIKTLFQHHAKMVKMNDMLDKETVELLGLEYACEITCVQKEDIETRVIEKLEAGWESDEDAMQHRPPLVSFLGHVDHGKTSLLDAIRKTNVAGKEHGGITQHIGTSRVQLPDGKEVVFVDTPGHKAFTEMRARGAQVTDLVVLVVAADDGVMPQTKEAIAHARAAGVPMVVALNKIDKPDANLQKVRQELANEGLQDESWGGDTIIAEVSATNNVGIDTLLESILLEAEVLELKADASRPAVATVVEAEQSKGEGNVARLIINDGTLKKGDTFVCGTAHGRIRAIKGPVGLFVDEARPSTPVEITGLAELPVAGDKLFVLENLDEAKEIAQQRMQLAREKEIAKASHVSLENLFDQLDGDTLKIILKVDVTGSLEVLKREIMELKHPEISPEIIHAAVGGITETDVTLADASNAIILGFHVSADMGARRHADQKGVQIRIYQVLYKLMEELKDALEGRLAPEEKEVILGEAEVRQTWKVSRLGTIAGCIVTSGMISRTAKVRIARDGIVVLATGSLASLKRIKDDVREVKDGFECGMVIANFDQIREGDVITAFEIQRIARKFEDT